MFQYVNSLFIFYYFLFLFGNICNTIKRVKEKKNA
nr:MAG TPA: hypothetical protein [Caudoviricetes sp.]